MKKKSEYEKFLIYQLNNVLRGDAEVSLGDKSMSIEDKKVTMAVIEDFKKYIDNYERNKRLIRNAEFYNEHMEDDLR